MEKQIQSKKLKQDVTSIIESNYNIKFIELANRCKGYKRL